jgi:hypothetical protein
MTRRRNACRRAGRRASTAAGGPWGRLRARAPTVPYLTASLTAFTGLARTALLAGFAANVCSCFVNGLMPLRAGRAGFLWTVNFARP